MKTAFLKKILLVFFSLTLIKASSVNADWINLTGAQNAHNIAEIYVEDNHIKLVLEIYVQDLDKLARSVSGNLLSEIYLQNRKSLIVTQAGGAQARVNEVEIQDVDVKYLDDRSLGLLFHAKWTAKGTVGHWGHIHMRKNQYEANITVEPVDKAWKITNLELLDEKRIDNYSN